MDLNAIIIFGSARGNGNTRKAINELIDKIGVIDVIDLANYNLTDYDYFHKNKEDDFLKIVNIMLKYEIIILATPVYWYTMSALMKRFIDRFSDILTIRKDLGRQLKGKHLAVISSYSIHPEGKDGFETIIANTANYLGMKYIGCYFQYAGEDETVIKMNEISSIEFCEKLSFACVTE